MTYKVVGIRVKGITFLGGYWSICGGINGGIAGMAAVCAGCASFEPWAAVVVGLVAGVAYAWWLSFFLGLHIDDPIHACPIHLGGGIWGVLAAGIFSHPDRSAIPFLQDGGIVYSGNADSFIAFGIQCIGAAVIFCWAFSTSALVFGVLRLLGLFRVDENAEEEGLDFVNGEPAYPIDPAILSSDSDVDSYFRTQTDSDEDTLPKT
jgi:ammonium transporter, Amt family